jgi:hypothetical protein
MVGKARRIVEDLGGEIATIADARRIIGLRESTSTTRAAQESMS